ncbi:MAG TPA: hypothetical protein VF974_05465, partial [Patescibacteria group bacterium]
GLRSDINTVYGITGNHGFGIFTPASLKDGQRHLIYAHAIDSASGPNPLIANSPKVITCAAPGPNRVNGNSQISAIAGGSSLTISTSDQTAGAITSIIWNGKEFINSYDHGRELQSAEAFDELGECYNPTEAGGRYDTSKSSSILKSIQAQGNVLTTQTDMAFWLSPGENYGRVCNPNLPNSPSSAQNTTYTAGYLLDKKVTIGLPGVSDQIIKYETTFTIPKLHSSGGIQVITGNMPADFTNFWSYNPYSGLATPLLATPNTSGRFVDPVILSTADGKYAMGVVCPWVRGSNYGGGRHGSNPNNPADTSVWDCLFASGNFKGTYSFTSYIAVGNFDSVKLAINQLTTSLYQRALVAPDMSSFGSMPTYSSPGAYDLSWRLSDAITASIDQGIGNVDTNGSVQVRPAAPTNYTITASNAYGSSTRTLTLLPGPENAFKKGDRVKTIANEVPVLSQPVMFSSTLGTQTSASGNVVDGPIIDRSFSPTTFWKVDFDQGARGWVYENKIAKVTSAAPPPASLVLPSNQRHVAGSVIIASGTVYYLGEILRYPFPSEAIFRSWGHSFSEVVKASPEDLIMPIGPIVDFKR